MIHQIIRIPQLKQEESQSASIGLQKSLKITLTADAYIVKLKTE
jgi:hypothetical protein